MGMPELTIINGDTESNVDTARARAEKLIGDGAQLLVGAFDSGQTTAIAQVAEQKGIPPGHQYRRGAGHHRAGLQVRVPEFPDRADDPRDAFTDQKDVFSRWRARRRRPLSSCMSTTRYGTAMAKGIGVIMPKHDMPYTIAEEIAYDPAARDLSVEVAKAKATNADALLVVSRLNDAMLLTRELIKQRWTPQAILSMGPGCYEDQYFKTLGKLLGRPDHALRRGTIRTRG